MPMSRTRSLRRLTRAIRVSPSTTRVTLPLSTNQTPVARPTFAEGTSPVAAVAKRYPAAASAASNESFQRMLTPVVVHDGTFAPRPQEPGRKWPRFVLSGARVHSPPTYDHEKTPVSGGFQKSG